MTEKFEELVWIKMKSTLHYLGFIVVVWWWWLLSFWFQISSRLMFLIFRRKKLSVHKCPRWSRSLSFTSVLLKQNNHCMLNWTIQSNQIEKIWTISIQRRQIPQHLWFWPWTYVRYMKYEISCTEVNIGNTIDHRCFPVYRILNKTYGIKNDSMFLSFSVPRYF